MSLTSVTAALLLLTSQCLAAPSPDRRLHHNLPNEASERDAPQHPPYLISGFNRIYRNEDASPRPHQDLQFPYDGAALDVINHNAALKPMHVSPSPSRSRRQDKPRLAERAAGGSISKPSPGPIKQLGTSRNDPDMQYIDLPGAPLPKLPQNLLTQGINFDVTEDYAKFYNGSGCLELNSQTQPYVDQMQYKTVISRDGGKGGKIGDHKLFIFQDTQSFSPDNKWAGFASNSIGTDSGNNAIFGKAPTISDKLGEFASSSGSMRNFVPFTQGEAAYNSIMAGKGQRFGIWPGASLIPYNQDSALLYAPIIYTNTAPGAQLMSYVGTTLMEVTVPGDGGPVARRIAPMLTQGPGIEWGCIGGIRKLKFANWGDGNARHGKIYILGNAKGGLFLARAHATRVTDWSAYEFWHASSKVWNSVAPSADDTGDFFVTGSFSTADIFYSPKHETWIMVYMSAYADNTFYYSYLDAPTAIHPSDAGDYVAAITQHAWTEGRELFRIPATSGYAYGGGMYMGYFDGNDITEGGDMMLVGWTNPTGTPQPDDLVHDSATVQWL